MKDSRLSESCRIVRVSPWPPSNTSWCATRPDRRTECTRTPSTVAPRAPSSWVVVASGDGSWRAAATSSAGRRAVPLGASALFGWCSSMISTDSKNGAACCAKCIMSTAPIAKLGAMSTLAPACAASQPRTVSSLPASKPVVPTTVCTPRSTHHRRLSMTASGWVKSTTASAAASGLRASPMSTAATSSISSAASTAPQTSAPTRPRAPSTPTLITSSSGRGDSLEGELAVFEGADDGEGHGLGEDVAGHGLNVVRRYRVDLGEHIVDRQQLFVHQLALADAAHPRPGVLEPEDHGAAQLPLAAGQLLEREAALGDLGHLVAADRQDLVDLGRLAPGVDAERAGVGVLRGVTVDRVRQPALLPDLLEQPRGHAAAERRVEHAEGESPIVGTGD